MAGSGPWPVDVDDDDRLMLELFALATPRREIGRSLGCGAATIGRRMQRLKTGLGVDTVMQVVVRAVRDGVI